MRQAYISGVTGMANGVPPRIAFFVRLTVSTVEAPKVTHLGE